MNIHTLLKIAFLDKNVSKKDLIVLKYIARKMKDGFFDTTLKELAAVYELKYYTSAGKRITRLVELGYLNKKLVSYEKGYKWKHIRLSFKGASNKKKGETMTFIAENMTKYYENKTNCKIDLSPKLKAYLNCAYEQKFQSMDLWKEYVDSYTKSGKVNTPDRFFIWLMKFSTINEWLDRRKAERERLTQEERELLDTATELFKSEEYAFLGIKGDNPAEQLAQKTGKSVKDCECFMKRCAHIKEESKSWNRTLSHCKTLLDNPDLPSNSREFYETYQQRILTRDLPGVESKLQRAMKEFLGEGFNIEGNNI